MYKKSMWWVFLFCFGLTIGSIQMLGWWTRQAAAQAQVSQTESASGQHRQAIQPHHWRSLVMHQ
jgi:hypothetical protein